MPLPSELCETLLQKLAIIRAFFGVDRPDLVAEVKDWRLDIDPQGA